MALLPVLVDRDVERRDVGTRRVRELDQRNRLTGDHEGHLVARHVVRVHAAGAVRLERDTGAH